MEFWFKTKQPKDLNQNCIFRQSESQIYHPKECIPVLSSILHDPHFHLGLHKSVPGPSDVCSCDERG